MLTSLNLLKAKKGIQTEIDRIRVIKHYTANIARRMCKVTAALFALELAGMLVEGSSDLLILDKITEIKLQLQFMGEI